MSEFKERKTGNKRHWNSVIAAALVFGLTAGCMTYGVNRAASWLLPYESGSEASVEQAVPETVQSRAVGTKTALLTEKALAPAEVEAAGTVAAVAYDAMPSLVTISTMSVQEMQSFFGLQTYEAQGAGTGVIVGKNDTELLIATNNHVVEDAQEVSVGFIDEEVVEAKIKGTDRANDLAVVAVNLEDIKEDTMSQLTVAKIGDSDALVLGEQVVAIGNALGVGQSVTSGYVSALNRELDLSDGRTEFVSSGLIQTDAAINSGNSGGALLNMRGELVGINEAKTAYTASGVAVDNVGYAIPMAKAMPILEKLMDRATRDKLTEDEQGYLGVSLIGISSEFSSLYEIQQGVGIAEVAEDSPAEEAGVLKGDILIDFNGQTVLSVEDVMDEIQYYKSGEEVKLTVLRADNGEYKEKELTVTLGTKEAIDSLQEKVQ